MGASFDRRVYPGAMTRAEVQDQFSSDRSQSQYENGHSYSGAIGMLAGPVEFKNRTFASVAEAENWLGDNHNKKWGPAYAVRAEPPGGEAKWVVGGNCSS